MKDRETFIVETDSVTATEELGARIAERVLTGGFERGAVFLLSGPLGAGKTAFVRGLARGLGCRTVPKSPTFALHHSHVGARRLEHFDLYRIETGARVDDLGLEELFDGPAVVAVEWPERLGPTPPDALHVRFESPSDTQRRITVGGPAGRIEQLRSAAGRSDVPNARH